MHPIQFIKRHKVKLISFLFILLFFIIYLAEAIFIYVYPGQAGLMFKSLSSNPVSAKPLSEGLYIIAPWNKIYIYDLTRQKKTLEVDALTNNGLMVKLRVSAIFRADLEKLRDLALTVGSDYREELLTPTILASTREVIGEYQPEELYTTAMHDIQKQMLAEARRELTNLSFIIEEVIIEELKLPPSLNKSIENKLKQQQDALAYQYILQKEKDEATRRQIEAESINRYQTTIQQSLNADILKWLKIRALTELGQSNNSKIVVFGDSGETDMPLLLNPDSTAQ